MVTKSEFRSWEAGPGAQDATYGFSLNEVQEEFSSWTGGWAFLTAQDGSGPSGEEQGTVGGCPRVVWPAPHVGWEEREGGKMGRGAGPGMTVMGTTLPGKGVWGSGLGVDVAMSSLSQASHGEGLNSD